LANHLGEQIIGQRFHHIRSLGSLFQLFDQGRATDNQWTNQIHRRFHNRTGKRAEDVYRNARGQKPRENRDKIALINIGVLALPCPFPMDG